MSLSAALQHLQDVPLGDPDALAEAIQDLLHGVRQAESLRQAILREHREKHQIISAWFCTEACRMAAES